jgi:predicted PolB exonuclease-like 3'-5' exonuclease
VALVIDIETVGQSPDDVPPRALDYLYSSLKRDNPSAEEWEERRNDLVGRFSLDPTTGSVVCIGLVDTESGEERALTEGDERELLASFWHWIEKEKPERFVTFNGKSFDFPYINIRSAILEVPPSMPLPIRRFTTHPHFDVREVVAGNERHRRGNLDYFCAIFGIASPKQHLDGARVGQAHKEGRIDAIARYCLDDCHATAALYERLKAYY